MAEDAIQRWPNNPELSCLSCWVLRSVVDPPQRRFLRSGPAEGSDFVLEGGGVGSVVDSILSYDSTSAEQGGRAGRGSIGAMMSPDPKEDNDDCQTGRGGEGAGGVVVFESSTASGSVFGTGDNETSDLLISLADDDDDGGGVVQDEGATAATPREGGNDAASRSGFGSGNNTSAPTKEEPSVPAENATASTNPIRESVILTGSNGKSDEQQRLTRSGANVGQSNISGGSDVIAGADAKDTDRSGEAGVTGEGAAAAVPAAGGFEGELDGEQLERLLKLAEATKVVIRLV